MKLGDNFTCILGEGYSGLEKSPIQSSRTGSFWLGASYVPG